MAQMQMSRGEMQDLLIQFSTQNPDYRQQLLENPREIVERQFGYEVPDGVNLEAVEETANTAYVVVPHVPEEGAELEDADLEKVAGGVGDKNAECDTGGGAFNTQNILNL